VYQAIVQARQAGTRVVVATQPRLAPPNDVRQDEQQAALRGMLARHFGHDPFVVHADLSTAVDLADPQLCFDGMHLTVEGNARVAARLADVLENVVPNGERRR
jgi:lysophospholipase L1-like esterase